MTYEKPITRFGLNQNFYQRVDLFAPNRKMLALDLLGCLEPQELPLPVGHDLARLVVAR